MKKNSNIIYGIHPVDEALQTAKPVEKILVKQGINNPAIAAALKNARSAGISVQYVPVEKLDRLTGKNHQGIVAFVSEIEYTDLTMLIPFLFENGKVPFILALDGITDVRNFGAIARSAECAGADAIIIPNRNSVSVNSDAMKTSAGALNKVPVSRVAGMYESIVFLKNSGLQVIGATEKTKDVYFKTDLSVPTVLIMGAEDAGISSKITDLCDKLVKIPLLGTIGSLNVSAAASILLYEMVRQRNFSDAGI